MAFGTALMTEHRAVPLRSHGFGTIPVRAFARLPG
jgi:hypothetical protein